MDHNFKLWGDNFEGNIPKIYVKVYGKKIPPAEQGANQIYYCLTAGGAWIFGAFVGPPSSGFLQVFGNRL